MIYSFSYGLNPKTQRGENSPVFAFSGRDLLLKVEGSSLTVPCYAEALASFSALTDQNYIGELSGLPVYAYSMDGALKDLPPGWKLLPLRSLYGLLSDSVMKAAGTAVQILDWDKNHRYCGRCGTPTERSSIDRSKVCPACGARYFPHISPAVIVAVLKGDEILLAHNSRFKDSVYSLLAGFIEPGENLEEGARREILEEVSIEIGEMTYFGSQSWPFPDSLMIGFIARYKSGDIRVDGDEITDAAWFKRDELPELPSGGSISRSIINWFVNSAVINNMH